MKQFRAFIILIVALTFSSSIAAPAEAAATKLYLSGASVGTFGNSYSATVSISPKRSGVAVSIYRLTLGGKTKLASAKTNSAGKVTIKFKIAVSTLTISAQLSSNSAVKSASKRINVQYRTNLSVVWPDEITCGVDEAYIQVSPKFAGRTVKLQWWNDAEEVWMDDLTSTTNSNGIVWMEIPDVSEESSYYERVFIPASGKYLSAASPYVYFEFPACDTNGFEISGNAPGGTYYTYGDTFQGDWEVSGFDSETFLDDDASVYFDVCNQDYYECDSADALMDTETNDEMYAYILSDDSGTFYWSFNSSGNYLIRLSVWDDNTMKYWTSWEVTVD